MPSQPVLDAMSQRKQGHVATVTGGGAPTTSGRNVRGIGCVIKNYGDPNADAKMKAIDEAITILVNKGYNLPKTITFHLSSHNAGFQKAPTEAFARKNDGNVGVEVFLGVNAVYSLPTPTSEGIAHKVHQYNLGNYVTTVAVHELGHVLHDLESTDYFWGAANDPLTGGDVMLAHKEISAYAATNKKEVVAEVFAAHNIGLKFHGNAVAELYARCQGPQLL
jgi:hypothetical protein